MCIETQQIFPSRKEATEWCGLKSSSGISEYLAGRKKSVIVLNNGKNVFPEEIETLLNDVFSGNFKSTIGDRNSYYNPDKANPNWGKQLKNVKTIKNHKFGYLTSEDPTKIKTSKSA